MPVVGVAKSGWGLGQFRDYAAASLKLNDMDPSSPAASKMLGLRLNGLPAKALPWLGGAVLPLDRPPPGSR